MTGTANVVLQAFAWVVVFVALGAWFTFLPAVGFLWMIGVLR